MSKCKFQSSGRRDLLEQMKWEVELRRSKWKQMRGKLKQVKSKRKRIGETSYIVKYLYSSFVANFNGFFYCTFSSLLHKFLHYCKVPRAGMHRSI